MQSWTAHVNGPGPGVAGTALANSTTETDISPIPAIIIPANMLDYVGAKLHVIAFGVFSTTATPTLKLSLYPNGQPNNALATTGAVTTGSAVTNVPWRLEYTGVIRTIGASGAIMGQGFCLFGTSVSAASFLPIPNTALATSAVDTTVNNKITAAALWGTASASNTITCHDLTVLSLC